MHDDEDIFVTPELKDEFQEITNEPAPQEAVQETPANTEAPAMVKRVDPLALAEAKLRQKEARLAESRNLLSQRKRKYRNSQLYVWGAMVESAYRHGNIDQRGKRKGFGFSADCVF